MKCAECGCDTTVLETRAEHDGIVMRRRRQCYTCGHRFSTFEINERLFETIKKYLGPHAVGVKNKWALTKRDAEIVRRILDGEKRYMLAEEYGLRPNSISSISRKAGIPPHYRAKQR